MKKRLFCIICAAIFVVFTVLPAMAADGERLFPVGELIVEDPIYTSDPWLLVGEDVFMTDNGGYPASFDNTTDKASFYYLSGGNSMEWLRGDEGCIDCLDRDFAVEYTVDYSEGADGYVALAIAYNYNYYVEVYLAPDLCGDIAIVSGERSTSMLKADGLLKKDDPEALADALTSESEALDKKLNVSVKVSVGESRMPQKIDLYVNGILAGTTNAAFSEAIENLTPSYEQVKGGAFPQNKLGNILAIEISSMSSGRIDGICVYSIGEENGNGADNVDSPTVDQDVKTPDEKNYKALMALGLFFGISMSIIAVSTAAILIVRKKRK